MTQLAAAFTGDLVDRQVDLFQVWMQARVFGAGLRSQIA
jgi:hypothetical protein